MEIIIVFAVIILSMVLHEMAHGYAAYFLGDTTAKTEGRLSLNPLVHLDPWMSVLLPLLLYIIGAPVFGGAKPVPIDTRNLKGGAFGMALVAVAGPLLNFILALGGFLVGHFTGLLYADGAVGVGFTELVLANLGFMVFNLIPIPSLDGSRILYAIMPDGVRRFMENMESGFGITVVFVLVMVFGTALSRYMGGAINGILTLFYHLVGM